MGPEFQLQMIVHRTTELRKKAADYRRVREVEEADRKSRPEAKRRRSLFSKIIPA